MLIILVVHYKHFMTKKILFPWLKKETLRWHVRNPKTSKTTTDTTTEAKHNLKSFVIQQSQVRT